MTPLIGAMAAARAPDAGTGVGRRGGAAPPAGRSSLSLGLSVVSVGVGLGLWQLLATSGRINRILLTPPVDVGAAALQLLASGELAGHLAVSLRELLVGLAGALLVGLPAGVLAGWFRHVAWVVRPLTGAFYATPVIVFAPLVVAWLGIGFWDKVALVFLEGFFQIFITVSAGVRALDEAWLRVAAAFDARRPFTFRSVVVPGAVPYVLAGVRLATGRGLVTVVVAELLASTAGLGWMVAYYGQHFKVANVFVVLVVTAALGVAADTAIRTLERRVERWRPAI